MKHFFKLSLTIFTLIILTAATSSLRAQDYRTGIGVRLGGITQGLTVKHFVNSNGALEGILSFGRSSFLITGLYEWQKPINNAEGLSWLVGVGAHIGFYKYGYQYYYYKYHGHYYGPYYAYPYYDNGPSETIFGVDFILGLEYKFRGAPITLGLDVKPFFDITADNFFYWDGALTVRYVF